MERRKLMQVTIFFSEVYFKRYNLHIRWNFKIIKVLEGICDLANTI